MNLIRPENKKEGLESAESSDYLPLWVVYDKTNATVLMDPMTHKPWNTRDIEVAKIMCQDVERLTGRRPWPWPAHKAAKHLAEVLRDQNRKK